MANDADWQDTDDDVQMLHEVLQGTQCCTPFANGPTSAQEPFANPVGILTVLNFRPCQALGNYTASWQGYSWLFIVYIIIKW